MARTDGLIVSSDIAHAWAEAILHVAQRPGYEAAPLVVTISRPAGIDEDSSIRQLVDRHLAEHSQSSVRTVANTIFPRSLWKCGQPAADLFTRYERIWPRIRRFRANHHGTYFRRFTCFGPEGSTVNQIEHVVSTWKRGNHRRSALQLAVFDPARDHTHQRQRGFPCLHQVALVPDGDELKLTAFYATQTLFEKAYGNYVGLACLGELLAHEMQLELTNVTCVAAVAKLTQVASLRKSQRDLLLSELRSAVYGSST